jgi:type IV pilus assembly protein PilA
MLARIRKSQEKRDAGFTLIELLVVMIIIGILAAIAIPVFLNQRKKARESSAKADVSTIGKELATYYVDGPAPTAVTGATAGGTWTIATTGTGGATVTTGKLSAGNTVTGNSIGTAASGTAASSYCAQVTTSDTVMWSYSSTSGLSQTTCP